MTKLTEFDSLFEKPEAKSEAKTVKDSGDKIKIMLAIPHLGWIIAGLETRIARWIMKSDYNVVQLFRSAVPVSANRNGIVHEFLQTDCDFLLMIDSDTTPTKNPLDLVKYDKDIVSGATPTWKDGGYAWAVGKRFKDGSYNQYKQDERTGLRLVDGVGASCLMIKRKVLETVKIPFMEKWNEIGERALGEDLHFCEKAQEAGFEVWCDWGTMCNHAKEVPMLAIIETVMKTWDRGVKQGKLDKRN